METTKIDFLRVNNDTNGNPRYVCHFLNLLTDSESNYFTGLSISDRYNAALNRARKIGGRKFHNKQFGGGIVFQSYNIQETENDILNILNS
jgi:hypothetical protein